MKKSKPYREYDRWETKAKKSANREYRDKKSDQLLQLAVEPPELPEPYEDLTQLYMTLSSRSLTL